MICVYFCNIYICGHTVQIAILCVQVDALVLHGCVLCKKKPPPHSAYFHHAVAWWETLRQSTCRAYACSECTLSLAIGTTQ